MNLYDELVPYRVWETNPFNNDIVTELIGAFSKLEDAKDYVDYQISHKSKNCIIKDKNGQIL